MGEYDECDKAVKYLIGRSLSGCVRDILDGKVALSQVLCIVSGTAAVTEMDWAQLIMDECKASWAKCDPVRAENLVNYLRNRGMILQPRLYLADEDGRAIAPNPTIGKWEEFQLR